MLRALEAVSLLGRPVVLAAVVAGVAAWSIRIDRLRTAVFLVATTASGAVLGSIVKLLVARPRPEVDHPVSTAFGHSFPSGHAMHSTIVLGAVFLAVGWSDSRLRRRAAGLATAAAVLLVGTSRLLLGVHFLTDVLGGFALGATWLVLGAWAFRATFDQRASSSRTRTRGTGVPLADR